MCIYDYCCHKVLAINCSNGSIFIDLDIIDIERSVEKFE